MDSQTQYIGKYQIISTLGRGSMGVVYKARDPEIGRVVAIKTLRTLYLSDDEQGREALQRFRQESRSAGSLQHPNIITIYEAGKTNNGSPYIVMSFIEGKSLEVMLKEQGRLDPLAILHYLAQVASALDYAHSLDIIHRDVKPSNVLVDRNHRPFLVDFGVAKLSDSSLTPAGTVVGTPSYMAPEQIRGERITGSSDIFSLAVVAYELFTGTRPFPGKDFSTVIRNIIHREPLLFKEVASDLPVELEGILQHGMSKNVSERPTSALEFIDNIARVFNVVIDGTGMVGGYNPSQKIKYQQSVPETEKTVIAPSKGLATPTAQAAVADSGKSVTGSGVSKQTIAPAIAPKEIKQGISFKKVLTIFFGLAVVVSIAAFLLLKIFPRQLQVTSIPSPDRAAKEAKIMNEPPEVPLGTSTKEVGGTPIAPTPAPTPMVPTIENITQLSNSQIIEAIQTQRLDNLVMTAVLEEIGKRGSSDFIKVLRDLSHSEDYMMRVNVAKALKNPSYLNDDTAFAILVDLLYDKDVYVRGFAAKFLGTLNNEKSRRILNERLATEEQQLVVGVINKALDQKMGSSEGQKQ